MTTRDKLKGLYDRVDIKFLNQFGFRMRDINIDKVTDYLHTPKDSSSLAVTRILFGLAMLFDIPDERGGAAMYQRWGKPHTCHFPLLPFLYPLPMPYMALVYAAMWLGALGITLGYNYRVSAVTFTAGHWYLLLVEKSYWNNHSYLFGLLALLLACTQAHSYWSVDAYLDPLIRSETVPYWNYFVMKYQFFILYFVAGLKKGSAEWLTGYSMQNLSEHWVFSPFRLFLTAEQTDYLIVHGFIFVFDLTVTIWMMCTPTRHFAFILCALFNLMNSRLFRIGMFPWVCLATMPLFYTFDWPKRLIFFGKTHFLCVKQKLCTTFPTLDANKTKSDPVNDMINESHKVTTDSNVKRVNEEAEIDKKSNKETHDDDPQELNSDTTEEKKVDEVEFEEMKDNIEKEKIPIVNQYNRRRWTTYLILLYVVSQLFLPFSHFITKGYNNWTNGLYGYSWDMMVHSWATQSVVVKLVDTDTNTEFYIDPYFNTPNERWTRHGDMVYQYAQCLKTQLQESKSATTPNISIFLDVWCSMNKRFTQRMFDPKVDLLKATWSPFERVPYLMPLLDEGLRWRETLNKLREDVHSWSNDGDVLFFADFPGYELEKYIPIELENVTLKILKGKVAFESMVTQDRFGQCFQMTAGELFRPPSGAFHKVITTGDEPAFYMYTFVNRTEAAENTYSAPAPKSMLPIGNELLKRFYDMIIFGNLVLRSIYQIFFRVPMSVDNV